MRWPLLLVTTLATAGCERFEAPDYAANQVIPAEVTAVATPTGDSVRFVRDTRARDRGPQLAVFQGGQLRVVDGCVLLEQALIVWPREARLEVSRTGRIAVTDEGATAIVGEYLSPTGGVIPGRIDNPQLGPCADRPLFLVNGFEPISPAAWAELQSPERRTRPAPPPGSLRPTRDDDFPHRGRWVVAAIDGRAPPPGDPPITVGLGPGQIAAQSQCIPWRWAVLPASQRPRTRLTNGSEPICDRGRSDWEQAFEAVMNSATAFRLQGGDLWVSGQAGELVLRPAERSRSR